MLDMDGRNRQRKSVIMQMSWVLRGFPVFCPHGTAASLPVPSPAGGSGGHVPVCAGVPVPSIKCRFQAVQEAAASGSSLLLTSLCTLLASAEKCPPGHWPQQDLGRTHRRDVCQGAACFCFQIFLHFHRAKILKTIQ